MRLECSGIQKRPDQRRYHRQNQSERQIPGGVNIAELAFLFVLVFLSRFFLLFALFPMVLVVFLLMGHDVSSWTCLTVNRPRVSGTGESSWTAASLRPLRNHLLQADQDAIQEQYVGYLDLFALRAR